MRNWNIQIAVDFDYWWISLLDYLWGIETFSDIEVTIQKIWLLDYLWGIETNSILLHFFLSTYFVTRLPMRNWNIGATVFVNIGLQVTRLPMRNWNTDEEIEEIRLYKLLDYLWGIETDSVDKNLKIVSVVTRLPMRNWN